LRSTLLRGYLGDEICFKDFKPTKEVKVFTRVAIVAQDEPELQSIRNQLRNPVRFSVKEFLTLDDVNEGLASFPSEVLVMRVSSFETKQVPMLMKVRMRFPNKGLITVAPYIDPSARYQVREMPKHKLIHEPTEIADLAQIIDLLAKGETTQHRMHARVKRDGEAELVDVKRGIKHRARFMDFAQMGARMLVNVTEPIRANSRIQLHYRSTTEPGRIHKIESQVVWEQFTSGIVDTLVHGPQQMLGLRFIASL
jgi:hypothetical protein